MKILIDTQEKIFLKAIGLECYSNFKISNNKLSCKNNWSKYLIKILKRYKKIINSLIKRLEN